jgi:hypothetical protein
MLFKFIPTPINGNGMATTNSGCMNSLCRTLAACGPRKREGLQDREVSAYITAAVHAREKFRARSFTSCAPVASRHDLSGLYSNESTVANDCSEGISQWSNEIRE